MLTVTSPFAFEMQGLATLHAGKSAHDGGFFRAITRAKFCDGVVVLLVGENDALQHAGELFSTHFGEEVCQLTTLSLGTRLNSARLWVTTVAPRRRACAAISVSMGPIPRPTLSSFVRITAY